MQTWGISVCIPFCSVADPSDEATALYHDIDSRRNKQFDTSAESMDVYLLILSDNGPAQVHTYTPAEGIQPGTVKRLATEDILVASIMHRAAHPLAFIQ